MDNFYGTALKERYDITLNLVPLVDTADAVNQVLSEYQVAVGAMTVRARMSMPAPMFAQGVQVYVKFPREKLFEVAP